MKNFWIALRLSLILMVICGLIYPLIMTGLGQVLFPSQARGSLIYYEGQPVGSALLGQAFSDMRFFHSRISAMNYNTYTLKDTKPNSKGQTVYTEVASGSTNLAPSNPELTDRVTKDMDVFLKTHPGIKKDQIPTDLMTSSGSGLDPHISPASARIQIPAVSRATGISVSDLKKLVVQNTESRQLGIFGEPRVNVLKLNLAILRLTQ